MTSKGLRLVASVALFVFLFLFFVPIIYDATMFKCTDLRSLCLGDPSGLKSIGYALFQWGGYYSFGGAGDPQLSGYGFAGSFVLSNGSTLTAWGMLFFFTLPLGIVAVALVEPETVRKLRAAAIGFVVLGLLAFVVGANSFSLAYNGWGLIFDLQGIALMVMGIAMISFLYIEGILTRSA